MDQINFQPYDVNVGFNPTQQIDYTPSLDRRNRRLNQADQEALAQVRRNNQVKIQNAKTAGDDLIALSKFSEKLTNLVADISKKTQEDIEIGETYDALMGGFNPDSRQSQTEQALIDAGEAEAELITQEQHRVEDETGDIGLGQGAKVVLDSGLASGFMGERVALTTARTTYPAWMNSYLRGNGVLNLGNGQEMSIRDAIASGDTRLISAAIAQGRQEFIRSNNLHKATKRQFVEILGPTILNTDAQLSGSVAREAIQQNRKDQRSFYEGQGYSIGSSVDASQVSSSYRSLADLMWKSGAYTTRGAANKAALDSMIEGMVDRGDVDGLLELRETEKIEGNQGTRLGGQFGNEINDAIVKAEGRQEAIVEQEGKDIEADLYRQLAEAESPDERDSIIESAAQRMEDVGDYKGARRLRGELKELRTDGNNERNEAILEQQIRDGEITSAEQILQAETDGRITSDQSSKLLKQLNSKNATKAPSNPIATNLVSAYEGRLTQELGVAVGLSRDAYGNFIDPVEGNTALITSGDARLIKGQIKTELQIIANEVLRNNPGISDQELQRQLTERFESWWKTETQSPGGRYRIDDLTEIRNNNDIEKSYTDEQRNRFRRLVDGESQRPFGSASPSSTPTPQDFTGRKRTSLTRQEFNPVRGDKVFTQLEIKGAKELYEDTGIIPQHVQRLADQLGMTPLALLQQQLSSYGEKPAKPTRREQTSTRSSTEPMSPVEGAQFLVGLGLPVRGAAWLSGNIEQESSWIGNRNPWDDGGAMAGGLVSWRGNRLDAIESRYGRPISQITNREQLEFMVEELKSYPEANRIFRNPMATDRQLIRASRQFWSYGVEGERFNYAKDIERQLNKTGSVQNQGGQIYKPQSSSSIPYINQRTALNGEGDRQCFSAVSTMVANGYGVRVNYDDYNKLRSRYGDTTLSSSQVSALRSLGLNATVEDNGSIDELQQLAKSGRPVGIGINHNDGSGHWIVVTGVTPNGDFIVNDPYGQLVQQRNGGWRYKNSTNKGSSGNAGHNVIYSRQFLETVFVDRGRGTGRILRIS